MKLAILESRWADEKHLSVAPLFELLRAVRGGTRSNFVYERFSGKKSFDEAMSYFTCERQDISRLYLAAHGDEKILFAGEAGISYTELKNDLLRANIPIEGVYIGSCCFGNTTQHIRLLQDVSSLKWVAGYSESVDWGESSALDLIFFRRLLQSTAGTEAGKAQLAAERVHAMCAGLVDRLGFNAAWRTTAGDIECLI